MLDFYNKKWYNIVKRVEKCQKNVENSQKE